MPAPSWLLGTVDQSCITITQESDPRRETGFRSHLADGRVVCWSASAPRGVHLAIDAEISSQPVPPAMVRRFGILDPRFFWPAWTAVEVSCKLRDVPVLMWLRHRGLTPDPAILTQTLEIGDVTITVGVAEGLMTRPVIE